jgi:hypothetical protein
VTRPRPIIICAACGETREHRAHGWCQPCYRRWNYRGRPVGGPPPLRRMRHEDVQGTVKGWDLHARRKERACDPCRAAHAADMRARYGGRKQPVAPCGTEAAFQRHVYHGEEPCQSCRNAYNAAQRERYNEAPYHLNKRRHYTEAASDWGPEQKRAALAAADRATSLDDCQILLEALGLTPSSAPRRERAGRAA